MPYMTIVYWLIASVYKITEFMFGYSLLISIFNSYSEEEEEERVGVYVGEMPICSDHSYFEIEILDMAVQGAISIGKDYPHL